MRISDAERSRAVEELRRHCTAGRLDLDAFAARVGEAMEAETLAELDAALRDLPTLRIADPSAAPPLLAPGRDGRRDRSRSSAAGTGPAEPDGRAARLWARSVLLLSVLVVVAGVSLLVVAHWVWAGILIVGWIAGVLQGRIRVAATARFDRPAVTAAAAPAV